MMVCLWLIRLPHWLKCYWFECELLKNLTADAAYMAQEAEQHQAERQAAFHSSFLLVSPAAYIASESNIPMTGGHTEFPIICPT